MRDTYVQGRIRPAVAEFASTARSYLVYFTSIPGESAPLSLPSNPSSSSTSTSSTVPSATPLPVELSHPSETFTYLHAIYSHIQRLPPIARNLLYTENGALIARLYKEWAAWLNRIDGHVNRSGGMYGEEAARTWERGLEEMVAAEDRDVKDGVVVALAGESGGPGTSAGPRPMRALRDAWVVKVGWLIGRNRTVQDGMDEDEDEDL